MVDPADPRDITITFPFDAKEYAGAARAAIQQTSLRWVTRGAGAAALVYSWWHFWTVLEQGSSLAAAVVTALPWVVLGAFWAIGFGRMLPWLSSRGIKKNMPAAMGTQTRSFSPQGFFYATPEMAQNFAWSAVHRVVETDDYLLVFVAPMAAHFVPKHAIPVEIEAPLRELLESVMGDRPKKLLLRPWAE